MKLDILTRPLSSLGLLSLLLASLAVIVQSGGCRKSDTPNVSDSPQTANQPLVPNLAEHQEDTPVDSKVKIVTSVHGKLADGTEVKKYVLSNGTMKVELSEFGAMTPMEMIEDYCLWQTNQSDILFLGNSIEKRHRKWVFHGISCSVTHNQYLV